VAAFIFRFMLTISERLLFPWRQVTQSGSESSVAITGSRGRKKAVTHGD
jgi:hypothetical protein